MKTKRGNFSGRLGFVLAAAGSAVGLGNLWRFPYLAAKYGGGTFIFVYIICAVTFGFALLTAEIAIGRKTKVSQILAYGKLDKRFSFVGIIATIVPLIIFPYYCVIGGWVTKYLFVFATNEGVASANDTYFSGFISDAVSPLAFFLVFLLATTVVILLGVNKGIEKISKILMPLLVVVSIVVAVYSLFMKDEKTGRTALEGVQYYLIPDFSKFSIMTIPAALGQIFYSMSIAMGIMITFGSYTKDEVNLTKSVNQIEIFDTVIALLAGLMIIPSVFAFQGAEGLQQSGPGLMFISLPKIFNQMPFGNVIGILFFALVFFAAITSAISLMEALVSSIIDRFKIQRKTACIIIIGISLLLGIPSSLGNGMWSSFQILGMDFLTFCDFFSNNILMPIVALATCILIGWVIKPKAIIDEVTRNGEKFGRKKLFTIMIKYIAPICLVVILLTSILEKCGLIKI